MKILCFAFALCWAFCLQSAPAELDVVDLKKPKDRVTVEVTTNRLVFNVHSSDGIGAFKAVLKTGEWPREVSVVLNIKGPERFGFKTAHVQASGGAPLRSQTNICYAYTPGGGAGGRNGKTNQARLGAYVSVQRIRGNQGL